MVHNLKKAPAVENVLGCSLLELIKGAKRKMKISRTVLDSFGLWGMVFVAGYGGWWWWEVALRERERERRERKWEVALRERERESGNLEREDRVLSL
ncbi:hypothetical protein Hanom_Chr09g00854691 [Helianthus anomalus]